MDAVRIRPGVLSDATSSVERSVSVGVVARCLQDPVFLSVTTVFFLDYFLYWILSGSPVLTTGIGCGLGWLLEWWEW